MLTTKPNNTPHIPGRVLRPKPQIRPNNPGKGNNPNIEDLLPPVSKEDVGMKDVFKEVFSQADNKSTQRRR